MIPTRRHDIDALRVLLFGSLILYHVAMLYVAEWPFHLKSSYRSEALQVPMLLINRWRMPLLFLVSGIAMNFLHRKLDGWRWVANRTRRVLVPLAFGIVVVVPIQPYCQGVANHLVEPGFGRFLIDYFTFHRWPAHAFDGSTPPGITWNHLWYLAYLWVYSLVLAAALPLLDSRAGSAIRRAFASLRGGWLLLLPALPKTIALMTLADAFPGTNDLTHDWYQHALYFPYFLFGWWMASDPGLWGELRAMRKRALALAAFNWIAYLLVTEVLPDDVDGFTLAAVRWMGGLNTWLWCVAVLGWSATLLDRPFRWLPYATEAVLPWYVLHQSILIAVAFVLVPLRIGPVAEPLLVTAATIVGCLVLHEFAIRRSPILRACFGLKPADASRRGIGVLEDRTA